MSEKEIVKRYSNGEITVVWQPSLCIHSAVCARRCRRCSIRDVGRG